MRRSTIRRPRDDMRGSTIRRPREPAVDVAKIAFSQRRLEPPARAWRCAPVLGSPVRSTEPGWRRLPDRWPSPPQEGSHYRYWPHRLRDRSNLRVPASRAVALIHPGSGQVEAWQPAAQKKRCSPAALPTLSGAAAERSLALGVEARFRSMTRAPERRSRRDGNAKIADNQVQMLLTLQRVFRRRRPILRGHGRTGMIRFWIDLFSGTQILDPQVLVLRPRRTVQQR